MCQEPGQLQPVLGTGGSWCARHEGPQSAPVVTRSDFVGRGAAVLWWSSSSGHLCTRPEHLLSQQLQEAAVSLLGDPVCPVQVWPGHVPSPGSPQQLPHPIPFPKGTLVPGCPPRALQGSMGPDRCHQLGTKNPKRQLQPPLPSPGAQNPPWHVLGPWECHHLSWHPGSITESPASPKARNSRACHSQGL